MAEQLSHAYLVSSVSAQEREKIALELAMKLICRGEGKLPCGICPHCSKALAGIHPDVVYIERERDDKGEFKREMTVGIMREMQSDAWIRPNEAERKVYIIRDAQTMNHNAQNAILKLLEEPPGGACFILCADNAAVLLPTVRSRCVEVGGKAADDAELDTEMLLRIEAYLQAASENDIAALLKVLSAWEKLDTTAMRTLVTALCSYLAEALCLRRADFGLGRLRLAELHALATRANEFLRSNVGTKHVLGYLSVRTIEL